MGRSAFFHKHVSCGMTVCLFVDSEFIVHGYLDGTIMVCTFGTAPPLTVAGVVDLHAVQRAAAPGAEQPH